MGCLRPLQSIVFGLVGSRLYEATEGAPAYSLVGSSLSRIPSPEGRGWGAWAKADLSFCLLWAQVNATSPHPLPTTQGASFALLP